MKRTALTALLCALLLALCACAPKQAQPPTCAALADALAASQPFAELTELASAKAAALLDIDAELASDMVMRMDATLATAEAIVVVTAKDKAALDKLTAELERWRAEQTDAYRDYMPEELPKLEQSLLKTRGLQAVLVVASDAEAAAQALDAAWK